MSHQAPFLLCYTAVPSHRHFHRDGTGCETGPCGNEPLDLSLRASSKLDVLGSDENSFGLLWGLSQELPNGPGTWENLCSRENFRPARKPPWRIWLREWSILEMLDLVTRLYSRPWSQPFPLKIRGWRATDLAAVRFGPVVPWGPHPWPTSWLSVLFLTLNTLFSVIRTE